MTSERVTKIRPLAIAVIRKGNKVLAVEDFDKKKNQVFYRLIGGGIEFGEMAKDAVLREIKEEIGLDATVIKQLPTVENIFEFNGKSGHEIIIPFEVELSDDDMQKDDFTMIEPEFKGYSFKFIEITEDKKIYPEFIL